MPDPAARRLAETISTLERRIAVLERSNPLLLGSAQGTVDLFDEDGDTRMQLGVHDDGVTGVLELGGPVPATPVAPQVTSKNGVITVFWRTGGRINLLPDPSFDAGTGGWVGAGGATVAPESAHALSGPYSLGITWQPGSSISRSLSDLPLIPGTVYTATISVFVPTGGPTVTLTVSGDPDSAATVGTNTVTRLAVTFVATDTPPTLTLTPTSPTGGARAWTDLGMVEPAAAAGDYFDGDTPGYIWAGDPHASASVAVEDVSLDIAGAQVHLGDDPDFTPGDITLVGTITTLGASLTIPDRQPGDVHYVRLVLITRAGVTSDPSPATPTVVRALSGGDIEPGSIGVGALDFDPADPGDGSPPSAVAAAPDVTSGIGSLFVRWGAVTNPSRVLYDVHLSASSGFTPGAGTLAGTTGGTVMSLRLDPGTGLALEYGTTYYVKVVARDVDGSAAASPEGSGTVIQVTGPDIAVETVAAENIIAGAITGRELSAEIILASLIRTAVAGRRVEVDTQGIRLIGSDGSVIVTLPTDDAGIAAFYGDVVAKTLTVTDGAVLRSGANEIARDSGLTMSVGTTPPTSPLTYQIGWDSVQVDTSTTHSGAVGNFAFDAGAITGLGWKSPYFVAVQNHGAGGRVWYINPDGTIHHWTDEPGTSMYGYTYVSGKEFAMWKFLGDWYILNITNETSAPWTALNDLQAPAIGNDGTDLIIAEIQDSGVDDGKVKFRKVAASNINGGVVSTVTSDTVSGSGEPLASVMKDAFDFGATRYVTVNKNGVGTNTHTFRPYNSSGVQQSDETWPAPVTNVRGFAWDGTNFFTLGDDSRIYKHAPTKWTTASSTWWIAATWRDSDATGPDYAAHETPMGALRSFTMTKRAKLTLTSPTIPNLGGANDPDAVSFYAAVKSSIPARTDMWLQATPAAGVITATITAALATSGNNPPSANDFPTAGAGFMQSASKRTGDGLPLFKVDGTGAGRFDALLPPGFMGMWPGATAPVGWLLCLGQSLLRADYPDLATFALAEGWGSADGTHFYLPDPRGRVPIGAGTFAALRANEGKAEAARGPTHTHSVSNQAAHTHNAGSISADVGNRGSGAINTAVNPVTGTTGSSGSHDHGGNTGTSASDPISYLGLNLIIKY